MKTIALGIWFLLYGLGYFVAVAHLGLVLGILALVVGVLVLTGRKGE